MRRCRRSAPPRSLTTTLAPSARERQRVRAAEASARSGDHDDSSVADTHRLPPSGQDGNVNQAFAWQSSGDVGEGTRQSGEVFGGTRRRTVQQAPSRPRPDRSSDRRRRCAPARGARGGDGLHPRRRRSRHARQAHRLHDEPAARVPRDGRRAPRSSAPACPCGGRCPPRTRATARPRCCPGYLYERLDEIGLDFTIVYPGQGLQVITLPGMADDDLRRAAARAFNLYNAEMFGPYADRMTPAAVIPMHTPEEAIEELRYAGTSSASRPACSPATSCGPCRSSRASTPTRALGALPGLLRHRQPVRLRPGVAGVHRPRRRAHVPLRARSARAAALGDTPPVQPDRRLRRGRRGARQVALLRRRDAPVPGPALRVPRGRRHVGAEPLLPHARALGEAQRRRDRAPRPAAARHVAASRRSSTRMRTPR